MIRTLEVTLGDWSDDGHGKFDTYKITVRGQRISDEDLLEAYNKSREELGFNILDWFREYEESHAPTSEYARLVEAGFTPVYRGEEFRCSDREEWSEDANEFDPIDALMFFIGRNIDDFNWEYVQDSVPALVGGFNTILTPATSHGVSSSFGYGLFY